jgi:hypothetical protein
MISDDYKKIMPLTITVIVCLTIIIVVNIWAKKQEKTTFLKVIVPEGAVSERTILQGLVEKKGLPYRDPVGDIAPEILRGQVDKIQKLSDAQYEAYSEESERKAGSKYDIYPAREDLQKMKEKKVLMY